jgi:hypothetical protein
MRQVERLRYQEAAPAVKQFGAALEKDAERRCLVVELKRLLSTI